MNEKKYFFASDVHLSPCAKEITKEFCKQLKKIPKQSELYILGDLFDCWIGDDMHGEWLNELYETCNDLKQKNINIYIMPGNHDFLIGKRTFSLMAAKKINDPHIIEHNNKRILLTHGDKFCLNDEAYQRIRPIIQSSFVKSLFLSLPITFRKKISQTLNGKSLTKEICKDSIISLMQNLNCQTLIHGHLHRKQNLKIKDFEIISLESWENANNILPLK